MEYFLTFFKSYICLTKLFFLMQIKKKMTNNKLTEALFVKMLDILINIQFYREIKLTLFISS